MHGKHAANLLLHTSDNVIGAFEIETKLVRLVTDNAANNVKAFENRILPGFECYFDHDDDNASTTNINDLDMKNLIKTSFDNIAASNEPIRILMHRSYHPISIVQYGLKQIYYLQSTLNKVSTIAKLSRTSNLFAEKLDQIGKSIPTKKTRWNSQFNTVGKVLCIPPTELNEILASIKRKDLFLYSQRIIKFSCRNNDNHPIRKYCINLDGGTNNIRDLFRIN